MNKNMKVTIDMKVTVPIRINRLTLQLRILCLRARTVDTDSPLATLTSKCLQASVYIIRMILKNLCYFQPHPRFDFNTVYFTLHVTRGGCAI